MSVLLPIKGMMKADQTAHKPEPDECIFCGILSH